MLHCAVTLIFRITLFLILQDQIKMINDQLQQLKEENMVRMLIWYLAKC